MHNSPIIFNARMPSLCTIRRQHRRPPSTADGIITSSPASSALSTERASFLAASVTMGQLAENRSRHHPASARGQNSAPPFDPALALSAIAWLPSCDGHPTVVSAIEKSRQLAFYRLRRRKDAAATGKAANGSNQYEENPCGGKEKEGCPCCGKEEHPGGIEEEE